ncbi:MAG: ATP-binding protein [Candidatus Shikimatogenerans bostrichidophilus]|nr:MAG: ATP-binding protein [Candidatus Shikimatogenerans bostrichidophilus]
MNKGKIPNFFYFIKKYLYTEKDVFLRELINYSCYSIKIYKKKINKKKKLEIKIILNKKKKYIIIKDNGIGMTYKDIKNNLNNLNNLNNSILGFFNIGFYSSFLVSKKVEILSRFYKNNSGIHCIFNDNIIYYFKKKKNIKIGTTIILHIKNKKFLDSNLIKNLLKKYFKFLLFPIKFNNKIINKKHPIWINNKIKKKKAIEFYHYLYKDYNDPILWIKFKKKYNLKGILYLPVYDNIIDIKENNIHLYKKRIFITDNLKKIIPNFLVILKGIIEINNIKLNITRSIINNNKKNKKISNYIIKKICNKIISYIKKKNLNNWKYIEPLVIYGILSNEYFLKNYKNLILFKTIKKKYLTIKKIINLIKKNKKQISKDNKIVIFYYKDYNKQYSYIKETLYKGYKYIVSITNPLFYYVIQKLENINNNLLFISVDSNLNNIFIKKKVKIKNKKKIINLIKKNITFKKKININIDFLSKKSLPINITKSEFINRYKEINIFNPNISFIPEKYYLTININNKLIKFIFYKKKIKIIKVIFNLFFLFNNLFKIKYLKKIIKYLLNN